MFFALRKVHLNAKNVINTRNGQQKLSLGALWIHSRDGKRTNSNQTHPNPNAGYSQTEPKPNSVGDLTEPELQSDGIRTEPNEPMSN